MPSGIIYPCTQHVNNETIFIFGEEWKHHPKAESSGVADRLTKAYLYNETSMKFSNISGSPCNIVNATISGQYSCSFLKSDNMVIIAVENCGAALNLTSLSWTLIPLPLKNGILFNADWSYQGVYYISSHNDTQSHIYSVLTVLRQVLKNYDKC